MTTIDTPKPFDGLPEQRKSNYDSHRWTAYGEEVLCSRCDARICGEHAYYPCGEDAPRIQIGA